MVPQLLNLHGVPSSAVSVRFVSVPLQRLSNLHLKTDGLVFKRLFSAVDFSTFVPIFSGVNLQEGVRNFFEESLFSP